jgi:pilus assembly protein CpaB
MSMKPARLAVLAISVAAAGGAMFILQRPPAPVVVMEQGQPVSDVAMEDVLVVKIDAPMGTVLKPEDLGWDKWPTGSIAPGLITRATLGETGEKEFQGAIVRHNFFANEPIRREKIIKTEGTGFMSAILPSGMRAISITIEGSGSDVAGGFILPNDRVDVINTFRDEDAKATVSEALLTNVRVLAMGQQVREEDGKTTIIAGNATLELDPKQVEIITKAQRTGKLSLALRALVDNKEVPGLKPVETTSEGLTVVRMGVSQKLGNSGP